MGQAANAARITSLALALIASAPGDARAQASTPIDVTVRGSTAGGYAGRTSTDSSIREPIDAATMIAELPGVHIRRLGPESAFAALSVRGSASTQVGVVLAGVPLTSAADPAFDVGSLPLWPGASFRVYRGFAPASLGTTGYLGGVLAVDAPSPALGQRTESWLGAGSFGSLKLRVGDLRRVGDLQIGTGLFASRSDGDFSFELYNPGTQKLEERVRQNAGHVSVGGIERVSLERPWGSASALVFVDARRLGVPGKALYPTQLIHTSTSRIVAAVDTTLRTQSPLGAVRILGWARRQSAELDDPINELDGLRSYSSKSAIEAAGLSVGWRGRILDPLSGGLTLDARAERFLPQPLENSVSPDAPPASRLFAGLGLELTYRPTDQLTIAGSARFDARRDDATGRALNGKPLGVTGGIGPSGHLGASYRLHRAAVVSAHAGALWRPPSFQELYGNSTTLLGQPDLRPERAFSADLGLHGDLGESHAALGYELVAFVTSARDLIIFTPYGRSTFRAENIDAALLGGAEISASFAAAGLLHQLSYTFLFTRNETLTADGKPGSGYGRPLPARPQHDLAYDAAYRLGPLRLRYGLDAIAGTTVDTSGAIVLPARILHSAGATVDIPWAPGLRAGVDISNLFDLRTSYVESRVRGAAPGAGSGAVPFPISDFFGFPLPGRSIWFTLRFEERAPE